MSSLAAELQECFNFACDNPANERLFSIKMWYCYSRIYVKKWLMRGKAPKCKAPPTIESTGMTTSNSPKRGCNISEQVIIIN